VIGLVALLVFILIGATLGIFVLGYGFASDFWFIAIISILSVGLLAAIILLILDATYVGRLIPFAIKTSSNKVVRLLWDIYESYSTYSDKPLRLFVFFLFSLLENLFPILWTYLLVLAFNIDVDLVHVFILVPIILILVRIPVSFDGIGVQELGFVYLLSFAGVVATEAFVLGVFSHFIAIISVLPGAFLYAFAGLSSSNKVEKANSAKNDSGVEDRGGNKSDTAA
jgi:uncharacterized membrane protein YbhN (UPF0104 family)